MVEVNFFLCCVLGKNIMFWFSFTFTYFLIFFQVKNVLMCLRNLEFQGFELVNSNFEISRLLFRLNFKSVGVLHGFTGLFLPLKRVLDVPTVSWCRQETLDHVVLCSFLISNSSHWFTDGLIPTQVNWYCLDFYLLYLW